MDWVRILPWAAALVIAGIGLPGATCRPAVAAQGAAKEMIAIPAGGSGFKILHGTEPYLDLAFIGWGPNWSWAGWEGRSQTTPSGNQIQATMRLNTGATLSLICQAQRTAPRTLQLDLELKTDRDTDLTGAMVALSGDRRAFAGGTATPTGGPPIPLPPAMQGLGQRVASFKLTDAQKAETEVKLDPPARIPSDGAFRIVLAEGRISASQTLRQRIEINLPHNLGMVNPQEVDSTNGWFSFTPKPDRSEGTDEVSMASWLEAPAGKQGRIQMKGDRLLYGGSPIRLWGINLCYADCAPPKELAERRAKFYARNGINAVRLHKYADGPGWAGIQGPGSFVEFDAAALDRMDYFIAQLKANGIFVKLSPTFGVKLGPEDEKAVPFLAEFGPKPSAGQRVETKHGAIYLSRELQDLQIQQTIKLLKHRNPYTGLTYAADPAIFLVEMYNEDSALFYGTMARLQEVPTLRARAGTAFAAWLKRKYGTKEKLLETWGADSLNVFGAERLVGESWEENRIYPVGNPWFFDPDQLQGSQRPRAPRLHDTMRFLYELQNQFYDRFLTAIRDAGYPGEVMASNWIAGRAFSHLYNLHSDARIGLVDRHNYFGGGEGSTIFDDTMLQRPGSGMLSSGMSQVAGRAFSLSEWIHVFPNEWGVEGPAILGAYGMGLNGWDVSFIFQNRDQGTFSDRIGRDQWDAVAPQVIGAFPAIARQVIRGDVRESELVIPRRVHVPSLIQGKLGFDDRATAEGDIKTSDSVTVPVEALAIGKNVVEFTDQEQSTPTFDPAPHRKQGVLHASTGQLRWGSGTARQSGWIEIDTPATKAVIGFAEGRTVQLGGVTITPKSPFAAIYLTARDPKATLATDKAILLTTVARARNTGMKVVGPLLVARGQAPILMEPVDAEIDLGRAGAAVHILDADGRRTGRTVPVSGTKLKIDGRQNRTLHYLVTFP